MSQVLTAPAPLPDLRLGDDCRLTAPACGLEAGAFVTVSGQPYAAGHGLHFVECEFGLELEPQWDEFPTDLLQRLCAACTEDATTRQDGALLCSRCCDEPWPWGELSHE